MTKYFFILILGLTIFSCKKNDVTVSKQKDDYAPFLAKTTQTFSGKLDDTFLSWTFGWNQSQGVTGYENGNGICDSTDPVRVVLFGLTSESDLKTRFLLYSPKFNSASQTEFSKVFSLGKKKLGDYRTDFYLTIYKDDKFYQSNSFNPANEIEILKTEDFTDNLVKKLRVWFRLEAKLSSCSCQNTNAVLADGLMIAEFYGFKKE